MKPSNFSKEDIIKLNRQCGRTIDTLKLMFEIMRQKTLGIDEEIEMKATITTVEVGDTSEDS